MHTIVYIKLPTANAYGIRSISSISFFEEGQSLSVCLKLVVRGELTTLALSMLIVGKNAERINQLKIKLSKSFAMKDLGPAKQILGIRITRDRASKKLHMSQEQYIEKVLRRFNMDKA